MMTRHVGLEKGHTVLFRFSHALNLGCPLHLCGTTEWMEWSCALQSPGLAWSCSMFLECYLKNATLLEGTCTLLEDEKPYWENLPDRQQHQPHTSGRPYGTSCSFQVSSYYNHLSRTGRKNTVLTEGIMKPLF